jgi:hypothetical protein
MSVKYVGNHSKGYLGKGSDGNGIQNVTVNGMGWLAVTASVANDVAYVPLNNIIASNIDQGIFFQSEVGATVQFSLANPALAASKDPADNAGAPWGNQITLVANTIQVAPVLFTVCKITFSAPGTVYIGVR